MVFLWPNSLSSQTRLHKIVKNTRAAINHLIPTLFFLQYYAVAFLVYLTYFAALPCPAKPPTSLLSKPFGIFLRCYRCVIVWRSRQVEKPSGQVTPGHGDTRLHRSHPIPSGCQWMPSGNGDGKLGFCLSNPTAAFQHNFKFAA